MRISPAKMISGKSLFTPQEEILIAMTRVIAGAVVTVDLTVTGTVKVVADTTVALVEVADTTVTIAGEGTIVTIAEADTIMIVVDITKTTVAAAVDIIAITVAEVISGSRSIKSHFSRNQ